MSNKVKPSWLKDASGERIAPKTFISQVLSEDGKSLDKVLENNSAAIIDVMELPTEDIKENSFYRLFAPKMVMKDNEISDFFSVFCVNGLPETGIPFVDVEAGGPPSSFPVYYNIQDNTLYIYVDEMLSTMLEDMLELKISIGWNHNDIATLFPIFFEETSYGGIITNLDDAERHTMYLLLEKELYSWNNKWISYKSVGQIGEVASAEVFNNSSNTAYGRYSHAEGFTQNKASNLITLTQETTFEEIRTIWDKNKFSLAYGDASHVEGASCMALQDCSHAEGYNTIAEGQYSHAEGDNSHAEGNCSHAEGYHTNTVNGASHAEGRYTNAVGDSSHAEGYSTTAGANYSHVEGLHTYCISDMDGAHIQGRYNSCEGLENMAHIVGNGKWNTLSNAHTLDWDGNAEFAGDVIAYGCGGENPISLVDIANDLNNKITIPLTAEVGQLLSIKAVDENGKPTDWECVDVVQADWNQNSELKSDYIKNRTHYEYFEVLTPTTMVECWEYFNNTVLIIVNGNIYSKDDFELIYQDNYSRKYATKDKEYSIEFDLWRYERYWVTPSDSVWGFVLNNEVLIKQLDEKYIPDNIPKVSIASVGQLLSVKAVDENGKPTEWETVSIEDIANQVKAIL